MANDVKFAQIAVALTLQPGRISPGREVLHLYGLGEDGAVYRYAPEVDAKVAGGGWKKMSMARLP